jgi:hypothetical protein
VCSCPRLTRRGETGDKGRGWKASTLHPQLSVERLPNVDILTLLRHRVKMSQGHSENDTPASCSVALMAWSISSFRDAFLAAMVFRMMILFLGSA